MRPGGDIQSVVEQRAARWKGNSYVDYAFHLVLAGALPIRVFDQIARGDPGRAIPSYKVFTTNILPPHPQRTSARIDFGRIKLAMEQVAKHGGIMAVHGEDDDLVQFNYEGSARRSGWRASNLHLVHTKLSELLAFRRTIALARATGAGVYFVHTSAREGVEAVAEARALGLPIYGETLHQYACFNAEYYKTPRGFCAHTYPSLKLPEDQKALWDGLVNGEHLDARHRRVPDQPGRQAPGQDDRGRDGRQRRRRGAHRHRVHRGRGQARHVARPASPTSPPTNAAKIFGLYPRKGAHRAGQRRRPRHSSIPRAQDARPRGLPRDATTARGKAGRCTGWPVMTLLRGKVIAEHGKLLGTPGDGRLRHAEDRPGRAPPPGLLASLMRAP